MNCNQQLTAWLNDAYSMERSLAKVLENHANDAKEMPEMRARLQDHLIETRRHAQQVEECLALLGEKPSMMKAALGTVMGTVQGVASGPFRDEAIKNVLSDYSAEHMEIACYQSLIAAAEELEQPEIGRICEEILEEEEAMAAWLEERIPEVTAICLQQVATQTE